MMKSEAWRFVGVRPAGYGTGRLEALWDVIAYLVLSDARSRSDLKELPEKIDGLPYFERDAKVKCNHLSL